MNKQKISCKFYLTMLILLVCASFMLTHARHWRHEDFFDFFNPHSTDVIDLSQFQFTNSCDPCPLIYLPVCGDDNKTYTNECRLHCVNKLRKIKKDVYIQRENDTKMIRTGPCYIFEE